MAGFKASLVLALACLLLTLPVPGAAGSLRYCDAGREVDVAVQDRLIQVAGIIKAELDRSGQSVAIVSRSGLALTRLGHRYSHAGVSLKASGNTPWSVRQLYYACDEARPRIFDQGMTGFVLGVNDTAQGYVSIVLLPTEQAQALERVALDDRQSLDLLGATYSANAYAFNDRYQNCNQWLAELLGHAWGPPVDTGNQRTQAQQWLKDAGYQPSTIRLWRPLMWVAALVPWLHSDDHPQEDLNAAQFRISMPAAIEAFVQAQAPQATRMEVCYTAERVVLRRGWTSIADGCVAEPGDEVISLPLTSSTPPVRRPDAPGASLPADAAS